MNDLELSLLRTVTTRLPPVRGMGWFANRLIEVYNRRPRARVVAEVHGFAMELDPAECVDGGYLFYPQLYDRRELAALRGFLRPGDTFLDLGAHIGMYALCAAARVGPTGRVLAVEADPVNYARLCANLARNPGLEVTAQLVGLSDRDEVLRLGINDTGNRSGNSFLSGGAGGVEVSCRPLSAVLDEAGIRAVRAAKLDLEGFEYRVLRSFFSDEDASRRPGMIVVEYNPAWVDRAGGDVLELLAAHGYREVLRTRDNRVWVDPRSR